MGVALGSFAIAINFLIFSSWAFLNWGNEAPALSVNNPPAPLEERSP